MSSPMTPSISTPLAMADYMSLGMQRQFPIK